MDAGVELPTWGEPSSNTASTLHGPKRVSGAARYRGLVCAGASLGTDMASAVRHKRGSRRCCGPRRCIRRPHTGVVACGSLALLDWGCARTTVGWCRQCQRRRQRLQCSAPPRCRRRRQTPRTRRSPTPAPRPSPRQTRCVPRPHAAQTCTRQANAARNAHGGCLCAAASPPCSAPPHGGGVEARP